MKRLDVYYEIWRAFGNSSIYEVQKKAGNRTMFYAPLCLLAFLSLVWGINRTWQFCESVYIDIMFYIVVASLLAWFVYSADVTTKFFKNKYRKDALFFKQNSKNWKGERFLLFAEKIKDLVFDIKKIKERIDKEAELTSRDFINPVHKRIVIPIILALITTALGLLMNDPKIAIFVIILAAILLVLIKIAAIILDSKETRAKELRLFLFWYEIYEKELFEDRLQSDNEADETQNDKVDSCPSSEEKRES
ncbi:hypothetical protein AGMMS50229_20180 [Campylobacterota bacterium]|nr:hypothetical protein AGMMS50229_20180 [Campylobacterota bacterium]